MAPSKHSRTGKKAWRQNIDTTEVEVFVEEQHLKERQGPGVETLADSDLFFIDQAGTALEVTAAAVTRKPKRDKKLLRCQVIIQEAHKAKPLPLPPPRRKHGQGLASKIGQTKNHATYHPTTRPAGDKPASQEPVLADVWSDMPAVKRSKRSTVALPVPAVEVDMPGCSYNPDPEQRQDAVAVLVAGEMKKLLQKELTPKDPAMLVEPVTPGNPLDLLLVDAEPDEEAAADHGISDAHQKNSAGHPGAGQSSSSRSLATSIAQAQDRKTKKERNKDKRRKFLQQQEQRRQALKRQRQELERLSDLQQLIQEDEEQKLLRLERKQVVKLEKAAQAPPRLGKHKFVAEPVSVLLSDEVTGSLRTITPSFTLLRDRFKSFQKRGILEPRKRVTGRQGRAKVEYQTGARREKAVMLKEEIDKMRAARKVLAKASS